MSKKSHYILSRNPRMPQQREADLALIARWYLRGYSQKEIVKRLAEERPYKLSIQTVSRDIQELHDRWLKSSLVDINTAKQQELERLRMLEEQYWEGWFSSRNPAIETETESIADTQGREESESPNKYSRERTKVKRNERDGSAAFLQGIERCIDMRAKILGLYEAKKVAFKGDWLDAATAAGIPESQANQEFEALVSRYQTALDPDNQ